MKEATLVLLALLVVPACLAAGEAPLPTGDAGLQPAIDSCSAEATTGTPVLEAALASPGEESKTEVLSCEVICRCVQRTTDDVTRVGATCSRARQRAAAAARELAVCPANSEGPCGPTTHTVDACQTIPTGGFSATARAFYHCEFCFERCL